MMLTVLKPGTHRTGCQCPTHKNHPYQVTDRDYTAMSHLKLRGYYPFPELARISQSVRRPEDLKLFRMFISRYGRAAGTKERGEASASRVLASTVYATNTAQSNKSRN